MVKPWAQAGFTCYCFDWLNSERSINFPSGGSINWRGGDIAGEAVQSYVRGLQPKIIFSFPPCTNLAVSGAKHFGEKLNRNPLRQDLDAELARTAERLGTELGVPWTVENPVSVLSTLWRPPDFTFDPFEFGGYLPANDKHPRWPKYIAPQDRYPKKTCIWHGNGFIEPIPLPVTPEAGWSRQVLYLGGKSEKTKRIRAETPRGFAIAVFVTNKRVILGASEQ